MGYIAILATILFTVYGQIIIKWRMDVFHSLPSDLFHKVLYLVKLIFDPFIFSGFFAAFCASICWMYVLTKFQLSYAYPFTTITFVLVIVSSIILFKEPLTLYKIVGVVLISLGILSISRSI